MSFTRIGLLLILAASIVACASTKQSADTDLLSKQNSTNELVSLHVNNSDRSTDVSLVGGLKPAYSVFRMSDPQRIIVDLTNCRIKDIPAVKEVNDGLLTVITTNQYNENDKPTTRVMLVFERETGFTVSEEDNTVTLHLAHPEGYTSSIDQDQPEENIAEQIPESTPAIAVDVTAEPMCSPDVPLTLQTYGGNASKTKLTSATVKETDSGVKLTLKTSGRLVKDSYEVLRLCDPDRIVVDLYGVRNAVGKRSIEGDGAYVKNIRLGSHSEKLRLVLDLIKPLPEFSLETSKKRLTLALNSGTVEAQTEMVAAVTPIVKEEPVAAEPIVEKPIEVKPAQEKSISIGNKVLSLDYKHQTNSSSIVVKLAGKDLNYRLLENVDNQLVLELNSTELPSHLEQSLDTSEFNGPITLISFYQDDQDNEKVKLVVQTREDTPNRVQMNGDTLTWQFDIPETMTAMGSTDGHIEINEDGQTIIEYEANETAGVNGMFPAVSQNAIAAKAQGQRISLELKNTDILDVLRLIADVSKLNIIASDDVNGSVTVRLLNVPWQQALDIILRSKGLGKERQGNIIRVAPLAVLQREREMRINQIKAQRELEPLSVRLIPISYSAAGDLVQKVQDLLTLRGSVNFDDRTNVIIVKDIDEVLSKAESLVAKLDLQTPQVMIEAKIVESDVNNKWDVGIQWGGYYVASQATGNSTGLNFPSGFGINGTENAASNYVVNLPSPAANSGLGFTFGNINNTAVLNLRLSAAEATGKVRILSSPRISTLDNKEAVISQGLNIPIIALSIKGTPVSKFVKAALELKVTPHITADGSIIMNVEISKQEADFSRVNALGDPAIIDKEAKTEVLVRTGETTVIGGIFTKKTAVVDQGTPGFSKIPVLGWLFKSRTSESQRTELLIFVTPRIINRTQSSLAID